jgi:serine/threonine protein kinase
VSEINSIQRASEGATNPPPIIQAEILVYSSGPECVAKYSITHGDYTIGRDIGCQVRLDVDGVSRHHARLAFQGYELIIEDLGSANGVFIEGVQITLPTRVRPDQQVEIGSARLFIRLKAEASEMFAAALWDPDLGLAPVRALLEGKRYKVQGTIGGGGMGVVHQARDLRIRRTVALKVIKSASQFSRENVLRFVDEAQLTGQLQHPNIVPVYDLGLDEHGEVFYTMKFVKGITLDQVLRGIRKGDDEMIAKYPLTALLAVFQKICDAVAYAHSMGVVHRDLKPDNVMIGEYGEVLVMDWGLAKKIAHGVNDEHLGDTSPGTPPPEMRGFQTLSGLIVGTPPYIAPEAARGELELIDSRSDIYVLGGILYAILTLRPPYPGKEFAELIEQIVNGKFVHPSSYNLPAKASRNPAPPKPDADGNLYVLSHLPAKRVPEGLAAIAIKAMSYTSAERYASVADLQADLTAWQGGFAPKAERAGLKRQLFLWAARHKGNVFLVTLFAVVFHASIVWFFLSLKHERDRARASESNLADAMRDLQGAAPLFAEEATLLAKRKEYEPALERIESAIRQVPNDADYHTLRGNLLQVLLRWDEAIEAYEAALDRNPDFAEAKINLELTRKVVEDMGDAPAPDAALIRELQAGIARQGRVADAATLLEKSGMDRQAALRALREAIENDPQLAPLRDVVRRREFRGRFSPQPDGSYTANFQKFPYTTLEPFFAAVPVQISGLVLDDVNIPDLSVLAGMRLRSLSLAGCRTVRNLQPLQELPELEKLNLARTNVTDLSPLAGLPLVELNLEDCPKLTNFRPLLECRNLEVLFLPKGARNIEYLKEHKSLKILSYRRSNQPVAEFWATYGGKR